MHREWDVLASQGRKGRLGDDVFAGFQDLAGKPADEKPKALSLGRFVGKRNDYHIAFLIEKRAWREPQPVIEPRR